MGQAGHDVVDVERGWQRHGKLAWVRPHHRLGLVGSNAFDGGATAQGDRDLAAVRSQQSTAGQAGALLRQLRLGGSRKACDCRAGGCGVHGCSYASRMELRKAERLATLDAAPVSDSPGHAKAGCVTPLVRCTCTEELRGPFDAKNSQGRGVWRRAASESAGGQLSPHFVGPSCPAPMTKRLVKAGDLVGGRFKVSGALLGEGSFSEVRSQSSPKCAH